MAIHRFSPVSARPESNRFYTIWNKCPKAIKLPAELAAVLYAPSHLARGLIASAAAYLEIPKGTLSLCSGRPIKVLGSRYQLFELFGLQIDPLPSDPKAPLTELDQKINAFERLQTKIYKPAITQKETTNGVANLRTTKISSEIEKKTNKNLNIIIEKVSYFSILQAMHAVSGIAESDATPTLLHIVDEASRNKSQNRDVSIWDLFYAHYSEKMGILGQLKAKSTYLLLWEWTSILPKTVDGYLKNLLEQMRINLKDNGEKRKQFINGLVEDIDNFLDIYNGAAETYAYDTDRKGNLNRYRKAAIDFNLPTVDAISSETTSEEIQRNFHRKLSNSMIDHFSPTIPFQFAENRINETIRTKLKNDILPTIFLNMSIGGKGSTQHNIPFFLALTKTLTQQISRLQETLQQNQSDANQASIAGIKTFEGIVKKLMKALDLADCKTAEEIKQSLEQRKESDLDATVRKGIEEGIQKGMAVLFDYLSKQENTEELFAILFESLIEPLSGKLPINNEEWQAIETEYRAATIRLKQSASSLFNEMVQEAIQDKVRGGPIPQVAEKAANDIFSSHKLHANATFNALHLHSGQMLKKIEGAQYGHTIFPELHSIVNELKAFENEERVNITMNQDPPPRIAELPPAHIESILQTLYPLYKGSNQLLDPCHALQTLQQKANSFIKSIHSLQSILLLTKQLTTETKETNNEILIDALKEEANSLRKNRGVAHETKSLQQQLLMAAQLVAHLDRETEALHTLRALTSLAKDPDHPSQQLNAPLTQLALFAHGYPPKGFRKAQCVEAIHSLVKKAIPAQEDQEQLYRLIQQIEQYPSHYKPNFADTVWKPLVALLKQHGVRRKQNIRRINELLREKGVSMAQRAAAHQSRYETLHKNNWKTMQHYASQLHRSISHLRHYTLSMRREYQVQLASEDAGVMGFGLGALFAFVGSMIGRRVAQESGEQIGEHIGAGIGGFLGTSAAYFVRRLDKLAVNKAVGSLGLESIAMGTLGGIGTSLLSLHTKPLAPPAMTSVSPVLPSALIGAMATSAGFEYAAAKFNERAVDAGVKIVLPKVENIFEKSYKHLLTNELVIDSGMNILLKQFIKTFPPKHA